MILQARRGFQTKLSQTLSSAATSFEATSAAVVSAAALFEELLPALAASNGPVRALLREGSGPSAAVALYQHAVDAVPIEVFPTTLYTGYYYIITLTPARLQSKIGIVDLPSFQKMLLLLCPSWIVCFPGTLQILCWLANPLCVRMILSVHMS